MMTSEASKKKVAYVYLHDHHDPIWRKAFESHFVSEDGTVVRPYSDREEQQLDRWFDILPGTDAVCAIEMTPSLHKYLERNPDRLDHVKQLARDGRLEFLGAGNGILDYNLVHGESIYRNFLYAFKWIEKTFGVYPEVGDTYDTFGLSAQMPQILRQFGFAWLPLYSRMFGFQALGVEIDQVADRPVRPFWRGIDGSCICIKRNFEEQGADQVNVFVNYQYAPCPLCRGDGCRFCGYFGLDNQVEHQAASFESAFRKLLDGHDESGRFIAHTEETVKSRSFIPDLIALGESLGVEVRFHSLAEIKKTWAKRWIELAESGAVPDDQIDIRREGNPIATGCYITRGILKRENRLQEHMLLAAEKFSTFASAHGTLYPKRAFDRLWGLMNLVQPHDAMTGNHPDGSFLEIKEYNRMVRVGAHKHLMNACSAIAERIAPSGSSDGAIRIAVFNPMNWTMPEAATEVSIPAGAIGVADPGSVSDWTLRAPDGTEHEVLSWQAIKIHDTLTYNLSCRVRELPPCGYATFYCRPKAADGRIQAQDTQDDGVVTDDAEAAGLQRRSKAAIAGRTEPVRLKRSSDSSIENERFRIELNDSGIAAILDKRLNRVIAGPGTGDLWAEDDVGSLWERLVAFNDSRNLSEHAEISVTAFIGRSQKLVVRGKLPRPMKWELPRTWSRDLYSSTGRKVRAITQAEAAVGIDHLEWAHEISLHPGSDRIEFRTTLACDSENVRLRVPFHLGFKTNEDRAWYEIPYGMIERPSYRPLDGTHNNPDGVWPAVHWVAAVHPSEDYACAVLNRGVPACRFIDGTIELHIHRSGRLGLWAARPLERNRTEDPLAKDSSTQVYEYALTGGPGGIESNRLVHQGYGFNSLFPAVIVPAGDRAGEQLPEAHSFLTNQAENVIIPAVKRAEEGDAIVMRLTEVYGRQAEDTFEGICSSVGETTPMEQPVSSTVHRLQFRPFEIKTVRTP